MSNVWAFYLMRVHSYVEPRIKLWIKLKIRKQRAPSLTDKNKLHNLNVYEVKNG
jgi:hypothetical protein